MPIYEYGKTRGRENEFLVGEVSLIIGFPSEMFHSMRTGMDKADVKVSQGWGSAKQTL